MFGDSENDVYFAHAVYTLTKDSSLETGQVKSEYFWEVNSTSYKTNTCFTCFSFSFFFFSRKPLILLNHNLKLRGHFSCIGPQMLPIVQCMPRQNSLEIAKEDC